MILIIRMDQQESARSINISSSRYSDKFQPQLIQMNQKQIKLNKEDSQEFSPIYEKSQDDIVQEKQQRKTRGNFKKSLNYNSTSINPQDKVQNIRGNKIMQLIKQKNLLLKFKERLFQLGHIYPRNPNEKLSHFLEEQYIHQNHHHSKFSQQEQKFEQGIIEQYQSVENVQQGIKIPIINPTGKFYLFWQLLRLIQIMFLLWWVPFKISFNPPKTITMSYIENMLIYLFAVDLLIKLNKGMIDQGQIIYDRLRILKHYVIYELYEDAIYLITLTLVIGGDPIAISFFPEMIVLIQFTFNFIKLKKTINRYGEMFAIQSTFTELVSLSQLIILIFYFAHFMACIWYYVGNISQESFSNSWIQQQHLEFSPLFHKYGYSYYWATATMVTVGYGDVTPQNIYEVICAIIMIFFASVVFAFSINAIGVIFSNIDLQKQYYKRNLVLINQYMNSNEVSLQLQSRVRNYLKYYYEQQVKGNNTEINSIIEKLSYNLKQELLEDVQIRAVTCVDFFTKNFQSSTIQEIACRMNIQQFTPREIIYQQNSVDEHSVYIIQKGEIQLIDDKSGKIVSKLIKGQCFGEIEFLTTQKRQYKAISTTFSSIYRITREMFLDIISENSIDFEKYCEMRDKVIFQYEDISIKCFGCDGDHLLSNCPYLTYKPEKEFLIKRQLYHSRQQRCEFNRKKLRYLRIFKQNEEHELPQRNSNKQIEHESSQVSQESLHKQDSNLTGSEHQNYTNNNNEDVAQQIKKRISLWITNPDQSFIEQQKSLQKTNRHNSETPTHKPTRKSLFSSSQDHYSKRHMSNQLLQVNEQQQLMSSSNNSQTKTNKQQNFNQLENLQSYHTFNYDLDKIETFQIYFPQNNIQNVINTFQKQQKLSKFTKIQLASNKYRFIYVQKIPIQSLTKKTILKVNSQN
ncbi:unnamed protein product [Paramecium pentaurelia]|uniref:Cyclic nucleotide-binding domain-containing protein n=1 Tax=Paramecium pentaurelia TaxID=43138 RepID=A0A8S1VX26_9CILI|nr:unnamed protein product [Paramecium pentaurelia]